MQMQLWRDALEIGGYMTCHIVKSPTTFTTLIQMTHIISIWLMTPASVSISSQPPLVQGTGVIPILLIDINKYAKIVTSPMTLLCRTPEVSLIIGIVGLTFSKIWLTRWQIYRQLILHLIMLCQVLEAIFLLLRAPRPLKISAILSWTKSMGF